MIHIPILRRLRNLIFFGKIKNVRKSLGKLYHYKRRFDGMNIALCYLLDCNAVLSVYCFIFVVVVAVSKSCTYQTALVHAYMCVMHYSKNFKNLHSFLFKSFSFCRKNNIAERMMMRIQLGRDKFYNKLVKTNWCKTLCL